MHPSRHARGNACSPFGIHPYEGMRNAHTCDALHAQEYQRLLGSQPGRRLNPAKLADNAVLHNKLVDITASLENLSVKDRCSRCHIGSEDHSV